MLEVQSAAIKGHADSVAAVLNQKQALTSVADITPDALYPAARSWMGVGQRGPAVQWIDPVLARRGWLELMLNDPVNTAALLRLEILRSELASAARSKPPHEGLVPTLWKNCDAELREYLKKS